MKKPHYRSPFRIRVGEIFFTWKRYIQWYFSQANLATQKQEHPLPYLVFCHQTPLVRKLKDVDMWMQENKKQNLSLAIKKLDKVVIAPGETFSYWKLIGKPTKKKGYVEGMILRNGKYLSGIGGGLCQLSNLIYWMTLHTPLTVVERWRHGYDVFPDASRTQPFGSGATCSYNYIDLQIKNNTTHSFQLLLSLDETYLRGEWRANYQNEEIYEIEEKDHRIEHELWGGYTRHNVLIRNVSDKEKKFLRNEIVAENHAIMMYNPFLENKK